MRSNPTFLIVTCAKYAVVALAIYAAWQSGNGSFLAVALVIALFCGCRIKDGPDHCPKCGHVLEDNTKEDDE